MASGGSETTTLGVSRALSDGNHGERQSNPAAGVVPIRGIRMKFAVLAGLVEVGEVSHRDIVETVFNLVSRSMRAQDGPLAVLCCVVSTNHKTTLTMISMHSSYSDV